MASGMVDLPSAHSVDETVARLESLLVARSIKLFAIVDHSGEAAEVGLQMPPTKLLIFGNPKAGTPLMQSAPSVAIDLPLKILVWQAADGKAWLSYNTPEYLRQRHGFPAAMTENLAAVAALATAAAR